MEQQPNTFDPTLIEPFTQEFLKERRKELSRSILRAEHTSPGSVSFRVLIREPLSIVVSVIYGKSGMTLFHALGREVVESFAQEGFNLQNSETEMLLSNRTATVWEINKRLPRYLKKWYPKFAEALPKERQRIVTQTKKAQSA